MRFVYRSPSTARLSGGFVLLMAAVLAVLTVAGCVKPARTDTHNPCPGAACEVPTGEEPRYVPQCPDSDGIGPCVGQVGDSGMWLYVAYRAAWPHGRSVALCPTEDGGPVPCVWVPSVQGNNTGDSGALVYGVK